MTIKIQQELYFKRLSSCNPYLWESICEWYATGDHWPSIDELKQTIAHNSPAEKPQPLIEPNWSNAPEHLALLMAYHKRESCTIREAALKIIPEWITANQHHPDRQDAENFLISARGNFGIAQGSH